MHELSGEDLTDHIEHVADGASCDCRELPGITEVQRFTYRPGDRFIVRVPEAWDQAEADAIAGHFRSVMKLPDDVPVCVVDDVVDIEIVSPE